MTDSPSAQESTASGVPWWALGMAAAAVTFACLVVFRVGGDLQALLFLPEPPVPPGAALDTQTNTGTYGADEWVYLSPPRACFTVNWYGEYGTCEVQPGYCLDEETDEFLKEDALAAVCSGDMPMGRYTMFWEARIYDYPANTRIELSRQIPWNRTRPAD